MPALNFMIDTTTPKHYLDMMTMMPQKTEPNRIGADFFVSSLFLMRK